jgi:hypothetical protein
MNTNSTRNVAVGTAKKSIEASWATRLARNARQVCDARRAPERVGDLHLADQRAEVGGDRRPARPSRP